MSVGTANAALWRKIPDEIINKRNFGYINEVFSPDFVEYALLPPGYSNDRDSVQRFFENEVMIAFPDIRATVDFTLGDENGMAAGRMTLTGTHLGTFMGIPATGRTATWTESHFGRFVDGKLMEHWEVVDMFGLLQQLGVIPQPEGAATLPD